MLSTIYFRFLRLYWNGIMMFKKRVGEGKDLMKNVEQ